jgi:hypothetical protein
MTIPRHGFAFALSAALCASAPTHAQTFANVRELTGSGPGVGLSVDSVGLLSEPTVRRSGTLSVQIPPGAAVTTATLFTFVRFRVLSEMAPMPMLPGEVRLAGQPVVGAGSPAPSGFPSPSGRRCFSGPLGIRECFATLRSDVTSLVTAALAGPMPPTALTLEETGDSILDPSIVTSLFVYEGHALVVRYRAASARTRFVGVWAGTDEDGLVSLTSADPLPPMAACPAGTTAERDERVALSATITSSETGCEGSNSLILTFNPARTLMMSGVGGSDDGDTSLIGAVSCPLIGRAVELRALISTGSFGGRSVDGAGLLGRAVGIDEDELTPGPAGPRRNDELSVFDAMPTAVRLTNPMAFDRQPRSLGMIAVQYPVDGDSDGDGHSDLAEGICTRTNSDGDRELREDFLDLDSDDDCIPDAEESPASRITVDLARSDDHCQRRDPLAPVCDADRAACAPCPVRCDGMAEGSACLRVLGPSAGFRCGCARDADCLEGRVCDVDRGACVGRPPSDGGTSTQDSGLAGEDSGRATSDAAAREDAGASADGARSESPRFSGGACGCRTAAASRHGATGAGLVAALALFARRRRRGR